MTEKKEISEILIRYSNDDMLPIIPKTHWEQIKKKYSKELLKECLANHIKKYKPPYPVSVPKYENVKKKFYELQNLNLFKHVFDKTKCENVLEKFDYGQLSWDNCGLGIITVNHVLSNDISNYFMQDLRLRCKGYNFDDPYTTWDKVHSNVIAALLRDIINELSIHSYIAAVRLASYVATQFKPAVANIIYKLTKANKVLDTSCGWGDRLAGFYCSDAKFYVGCDPNREVFERYKLMCKHYEMLLGNDSVKIEETESYFKVTGRKNVTIYHSPAEDLPWNELGNDFDCSFTSPPYFSTEEYGKGGEFESYQSWSRYDTYEKWRDNFFLPVSENSFNALTDGGYFILNILDPKIKGNRYHTAQDLFEHFKSIDNSYFCGNIGMRFQQRPKSLNLFDSEKKGLKKFMESWYIEPMWTFRKNETHCNLFSPFKKSRTLEFI